MTGITTADQMGGLVTRRCAHVGLNGGGYAQVHGRGCRRSRRRSVSVKRAGFHVTRAVEAGYLGVSFVLVDWKVKVF